MVFTQPTQLDASIIAVNPTCNNGSNGKGTVTATGLIAGNYVGKLIDVVKERLTREKTSFPLRLIIYHKASIF